MEINRNCEEELLEDTKEGIPGRIENLSSAVECLRLRNSLVEILEELKIRRVNDIENEEKIRSLDQDKYELMRKCETEAVKLRQMTESHHKQLQDVEKKNAEKLGTLEELVKQHQVHKDCTEKEIVLLRDEIRSLQVSKYSLEKDLKDQERKLQLQVQSSEQHLNQLSAADEKFVSLTAHCRQLAETQEKLEKSVQKAMVLNHDLTYINEHQKCLIQQEKCHSEDLQSQLVEVKSQLQQKPDETSLLQYEQEISSLQQNISKIEAEKDELKEENNHYKQRYEEYTEKVQETHKLIERHMLNAESHKKEASQQKIIIEQQLKDLSATREDLGVVNKKLANQREDHGKEVEEWKHKLTILREDLDKVKKDLEDQKKGSEDLEELNSTWANQNMELATQLDIIKESLNKPKNDKTQQTDLCLMNMEESECQVEVDAIAGETQTEAVPIKASFSQTVSPELSSSCTQTKDPALANTSVQTVTVQTVNVSVQAEIIKYNSMERIICTPSIAGDRQMKNMMCPTPQETKTLDNRGQVVEERSKEISAHGSIAQEELVRGVQSSFPDEKENVSHHDITLQNSMPGVQADSEITLTPSQNNMEPHQDESELQNDKSKKININTHHDNGHNENEDEVISASGDYCEQNVDKISTNSIDSANQNSTQKMSYTGDYSLKGLNCANMNDVVKDGGDHFRSPRVNSPGRLRLSLSKGKSNQPSFDPQLNIQPNRYSNTQSASLPHPSSQEIFRSSKEICSQSLCQSEELSPFSKFASKLSTVTNSSVKVNLEEPEDKKLKKLVSFSSPKKIFEYTPEEIATNGDEILFSDPEDQPATDVTVITSAPLEEWCSTDSVDLQENMPAKIQSESIAASSNILESKLLPPTKQTETGPLSSSNLSQNTTTNEELSRKITDSQTGQHFKPTETIQKCQPVEVSMMSSQTSPEFEGENSLGSTDLHHPEPFISLDVSRDPNKAVTCANTEISTSVPAPVSHISSPKNRQSNILDSKTSNTGKDRIKSVTNNEKPGSRKTFNLFIPDRVFPGLPTESNISASSLSYQYKRTIDAILNKGSSKKMKNE